MKKPGIVALLLVLACAAFLVANGDVGGGEGEEAGAAPAATGDLLEGWRALGLAERLREEYPPRVPGPSWDIARVRDGATVELHARPRGPAIAELGDTTEFGSRRHFWVAERKPGWLGVPATKLPNGVLGWIRDDPAALEPLSTPYFVEADISDRMLELHRGRKVLERFPVTVGAPGSPTPPGAYSVTDGLAGRSVGRYYGCCVLALSGHQPNLPADWLGGDRIGIHGTPGATGLAASSGCLRASDEDMVSLFARVPLGTPVFIRL